LITTVIVIVYTIIYATKHPVAEGIEVINSKTFLNVVGFAVYSYEGIGIIIPVMDITENKEQFPKILLTVLTTVFLLYTFFGEFCYIIYGSAITKPLITSNLPEGDPVVSIIKVLFCINLFFTYPLVIYPAN
jgi:proton-coupled amino acid transporter